ncbi:hypothetical protein ACFW6F_39230 [Streptomyces sp. NPDC058746]|uniref:hypothetical protein n=1 Tax=Streptomyces sp. NPDC058746 TaxID=3346622 RepID=UPI0036C6D871
MSSIAVPAVTVLPSVTSLPPAAAVPAEPAIGAAPAEPAVVGVPTPPTGSPRTELRGRIGAGFSPVPHRYRLYLAPDCPRSLRVAAALAALGLEGSVAATVLPADTGRCDAGAHAALRRAYEAAGHHFDGMLTVPALVDTWSGRVVSNHTAGILDDLRFLGAHPAFRTVS